MVGVIVARPRRRLTNKFNTPAAAFADDDSVSHLGTALRAANLVRLPGDFRRLKSNCTSQPDESDQTLSLSQEFGETKDWFVQHKRDPFLWLIILGPLALATITFWWIVVFPPSDAIRAIRQVPPNARILLQPKYFPSCRAKKYIFGYDIAVKNGGSPAEDIGRICRDVVNGGWVLEIDNPKFEYLEHR